MRNDGEGPARAVSRIFGGCGWIRRAALLKKPHWGFFARRDASAGPQLFESTRRGVTLVFCKRKRPAYFLRWSFWWARAARQAALLKKPHRGFFARRNANAGPQLFESTRGGVTLGFLQKKKTGVFSTLVFLVGAGVSASRAAKKAPPGLFPRRDASAGPQLFESTRESVTLVFCKRKKPAYFLRWSFWWARVSRRAALLKKPHWGFFARRDASAGPQLFESTREGVTLVFCKRKRPAYFLRWFFWWARVDSNHRS